MSNTKCPAAVIVVFEECGDDQVRVHSKNLRGLHLAGSRETVWAMIPDAIKFIVEMNFGGNVRTVIPAKSVEETFANLPNDVEMHVDHDEQVFLVEMALAA